jgi:hypothetical protein
MTFAKLNFYTPVHYEVRPSYLSLNGLREIVDDYCAWGDETANVPAGFTNCVELRNNNIAHDCQYWIKCALKVASYCTLIIPVLMYLAKFYLRSSAFYIISRMQSDVTQTQPNSIEKAFLQLGQPRALTAKEVEEMSCDQFLEISSSTLTCAALLCEENSILSITLNPTVLESAITCLATEREVLSEIVEKSRDINREIPTTIRQEEDQEEPTPIRGTITPLELAFLNGNGCYPLLIKKGAKLSAKPLSVIHSAITGYRLAFLLRDCLQIQEVQAFVLDCFKKFKVNIARIDSVHPRAIWRGHSFENNHFIAALIGFDTLETQPPMIFEIFKQFLILGADFHQASIGDEKPVLVSSIWTRKFAAYAQDSLLLNRRRQTFQHVLSFQRKNNKQISAATIETHEKIVKWMEEFETKLSKEKRVIDQAPFQEFINFHQTIFYLLNESLDNNFPSALLDIICEYITDINNTLLINYKKLLRPDNLVSHFIPDLIPCLIICEYLDKVDYSQIIDITHQTNRYISYDTDFMNKYGKVSSFNQEKA